MALSEEFRIYMTAANRNQGNQNDKHLSEATIFAHYRGELSEAEREITEAHLVSCAECIALFRSVNDFLEPPTAVDEDISAAETNQQWQLFLQGMKIPSQESHSKHATSVVQADFKAPPYKKSPLHSRLTLALAASLAISIGTGVWLTWGFRQERQSRRQAQELSARLENEQAELKQRLAQVTESSADEIKREREQRLAAEEERNRLQDLLAAAQPQANYVRTYSFTLSSDRGTAEELQLKLNSVAKVNLLISKPGAFGRYEVDILDEGGTTVRKFQGLRPGGVDGALSFRLNRGALRPGKYRLRLSGQQGSSSTQLGEYSLLVTGPA